MMSSEESANCCGVIENKLLQSKVKRTRQRVDAGEPRNSYSSIPNFTSRPSFLSSGLYSAIFNQGHKNFGFFGSGFAPAKMLNELLNRQVKTGSEASSPCDNMIAVDSANAEAKMNLDCLKAAALHQGLDEENRPGNEMAHNMLRDILQGRKKELLALENELRSVSANGVKSEPLSLENNNSINNNNNTLNNNNVKMEYTKGAISDVLDGEGKADVMSVDSEPGNADSDNSVDQDSQDRTGQPDEAMSEVRVKTEDGLSNACSDSESLPSPMSETKDDPEVEASFPKSPERAPKTGLEMKRARVENIVSTMRSSPTLPSLPVNGCKKRKLYHPQQHDSSAAERYADNGLSNPPGPILDDSDSEPAEPQEIRQKIVEKNALKSQLRTMQEQLAEMQHKYVQLCSRMDLDSEGPDPEPDDPDVDQESDGEAASDTEVKKARSSVGPPVLASSVPAFPFASTPTTQAASPAIPLKLHPDPHLLLPGLNGPLSMMQGQHLSHSEHAQLNYPHNSFSNAAAMYLGVNHKLFFDPESRMSKESDQHRSLQQKHDELKQQQHAQQHHQQQSSQSHKSLPHGCPPHLGSSHGPPTPHHLQNLQNEMQNRLHSPQKRPSSEFTDRLSMFRNTVSGMGPVSGTDLEGLADVLKTEITSSLTNLIDSIINRFVHQRRLLGKQTDAASVAAEQLNKDLMLASQLLDRKSPRTKVIDRTPSVSSDRLGAMPSNQQKHSGPSQQPQQLTPTSTAHNTPANTPNSETAQHNGMPIRPSPSSGMFHAPKLPGGGMNPAAAAALYSSISNMSVSSVNPLCLSSESRDSIPEQNEALSLVVAPKKKRHKVTDTRITPRTVSRILAQDSGPSPSSLSESGKPYGAMMSSAGSNSGAESPPPPPPRPYHPPSMLPVSLPTSVAIPNPSLHESQVFSPYSPFFHQHPGHHLNGSPPGVMDHRDSPPLPNPPTMLHPALLAAAHHSATPDYVHFRASSALQDCGDRNSEGNSVDGPFDGLQPSISFYQNQKGKKKTQKK